MNGRTNDYSGVPAALRSGETFATRLFRDRAIDHVFNDPPPMLARLFFGRRALQMTPPQRPLLMAWSNWCAKWGLLAIVLCVPAFLPANWLVNLAEGRQLPPEVVRVLPGIKAAVRWPIPWAFLGVLATAMTLLTVTIMPGSQSVKGIFVYEAKERLTKSGDPRNLFHHLLDTLSEIRHETFPNRLIGNSQSPNIGRLKHYESDKFQGSITIETQPVVLQDGRLGTGLLLAMAGIALACGGFAWVLFENLRPVANARVGSWIPSLATGVVAILLGRQLLELARTQLYTFRFESDLIAVRMFGTCRAGSIGISSGRGVGINPDALQISSETYIEVFAVRIVTECTPNLDDANSYDLVQAALHAPRYVVDTIQSPEFDRRMTAFWQHLGRFKDSGNQVTSLDLEDEDVRTVLTINAQLNSLSRSDGPVSLQAAPTAPLLSAHRSCVNCQSVVSSTARFCGNCGLAMSESGDIRS